MVTTTEVGRLSGECSLWRDTLRSFRQRFTNHQQVLLDVACNQTNRDILLEIEHLHNQLHIQLINIHDLKQLIKKHVGKIKVQRSDPGHLSDDTVGRHNYLYDEYQSLDTTLHIISRDFDKFVLRIHPFYRN